MSKLYPRAIVRMSPISISLLDKLKMTHTLDLIREKEELKQYINQQGQLIHEKLYKLVGNVDDDHERRQLINLRRDIYNNRTISDIHNYSSIKGNFKEKILSWNLKSEKLNKIENNLRDVFDLEIQEKRRELQGIASHDLLVRAIPLASKSLTEKWAKYLETPIEKQNKNLRKVELSIVLYLTRTVAKTSPFSSLTMVGEGVFKDKLTFPRVTSLSWNSHIEINQMIFYNIVYNLLEGPLKFIWPLKVNSTLQISKDKNYFKYVMIEKELTTTKFYTQTEKLYTIPFSNQINKICEYIKDNIYISIEDLKRELAKQNQTEHIEEYVEKLISLGILSYRKPFFDQSNDYISELSILFKDILSRYKNNSSIKNLKNAQVLLDDLNNFIQEKKYSINETKTLIQKSFNSITEFLNIEKNNIEPIIYENCIYNNSISLPRKPLIKFSKDIGNLEAIYVLFDPQIPMKILMKAIYEKYYNEESSPTLINFQKKVEEIIGSFTNTNELSHNVLNMLDGNYLYQKWNELRNKFYTRIYKEIKLSNEEYEISSSLLEELYNEIPNELKSMQPMSWNYFIQPTLDGEFVVNKLSDGHGRFMSRFMKQLSGRHFNYSKETRRKIKEQIDDDTILAELNGTFGFNANKHPSIAEYEIEYPGVKSHKASDKLIALHDLIVIRDNKTKKLILYSTKMNKKVCLLYVQFLNLGLLPPFLRFIIYFTQLSNPNLAILEQYYQQNKSLSQKPIVKFPRIKLGSAILLRKQWWVKVSNLDEIFSPLKGRFEKFIKLKKWIRENQLPEKFYIKANLMSQFSNNENTENFHYQDGMRKPQYIDTDSSHLVQVFFNQLNLFKESFIIEEALPSKDMLPVENDGKKYMTEYLIETYQER